MPRILNSKAASCLERPASLAQLGKYTKGIMNPENIQVIFQYKPVADPAARWRWGGGARNMKSMWPLSAAIFLCLIFTGLGGGGGARPHPRIRYGNLPKNIQGIMSNDNSFIGGL